MLDKIKNVDLIIDTSHYDHTFSCTVEDLFLKLWKPNFQENTGQEKVNVEYWLSLDDYENKRCIHFTIYDWKLGKPIELGEVVTWHIGAKSEQESLKALNFIKSYLKIN